MMPFYAVCAFLSHFGAYHHLIAVIIAAIATTALIINSAVSNAVGFFIS